jgi:transcriptional regulator with XRE-family HTH domain
MTAAIDNGPALKAARHALGLSVSALGDRLRFRGDGATTVREMESGKRPINGTTQTAVELLLALSRSDATARRLFRVACRLAAALGPDVDRELVAALRREADELELELEGLELGGNG